MDLMVDRVPKESQVCQEPKESPGLGCQVCLGRGVSPDNQDYQVYPEWKEARVYLEKPWLSMQKSSKVTKEVVDQLGHQDCRAEMVCQVWRESQGYLGFQVWTVPRGEEETEGMMEYQGNQDPEVGFA